MSRAINRDAAGRPRPPLVGPVGKKAADALAAKLGLHTVGDLLRHYPRRYVDRGKLTELAGLELASTSRCSRRSSKVTVPRHRHRRAS